MNFARAAVTDHDIGVQEAEKRAVVCVDRDRRMVLFLAPSSRKAVVSWIARTWRPATSSLVSGHAMAIIPRA